MQLLNVWECEFHKAFRTLRDGVNGGTIPPSGLGNKESKTFIAHLMKITPQHYWLTSQRLSAEMGNRVNLRRPPSDVQLWWAEQERDNEIRRLERELKPPKWELQGNRQKIWNDLVAAKTYAAVRKACGRWAQLPDVRAACTTVFPEHIVQNAAQFLSMKRNRRFPRSTYGDSARIDYLARGMAGVLVGRSPMTGIERLRNMKHTPRGPLWVTKQGNHVLPETEQHCGCWRCKNKNWDNIAKLSRTGYENGLRVFVEIAASTKVPEEWIIKRKKL